MQNISARKPRLTPAALLLSLLTLIVVATMVVLIVSIDPQTAYYKMSEYQRINSGNPAIHQSHAYLSLSAQTNKDDWLIFTPISYLFAGLVFGYVLSKISDNIQIVKSSVIVSPVFCIGVLALSFVGSAAVAQAFNEPAPTVTRQFVFMAVFQTVYWTIFYVAGAILGASLRSGIKRPNGLNKGL